MSNNIEESKEFAVWLIQKSSQGSGFDVDRAIDAYHGKYHGYGDKFAAIIEVVYRYLDGGDLNECIDAITRLNLD